MGYTVYGKVDTLEEFEELIEKELTEEDKMEDAMIRAANKAVITSHQLLDVFMQQGVMGVYHLGLKHMYEYLKGDEG